MISGRTLFIVATPIGNRDDLSARAIEVLKQVDRIYAEDTRHSLPLLRHHGIDTKTWALHEHNETAQVGMVIDHVVSGATAALITDAGTPLISDPGYRLVRACHDAGVKVTPVPGACAVTAALCVSGLPTDRFQFAGFIQQVLADKNQQRGEFVIVIGSVSLVGNAAHDVPKAVDLDKTISVLSQHMPAKTVARCAAELCGVTRKIAYDRALELKSQ